MSPALRQRVRERAAFRCEYCRLPDWLELTGPFHCEHIVARQHRGGDDTTNLAWACSRCNAHKGTNLTTIDPDTNQMVKVFHPRVDRWEDHFELVGSTIVGKTVTGRATAWLFQMNADRRVELRSQLIVLGLW